jgi:plastocyanin
VAKSKRKKKGRRWTASRIITWASMGVVLVGALVIAVIILTEDAETQRVPVRQQPVVSGEARVTVDVLNTAFVPNHLTVRPGTEIVWKFGGDDAHTVTEYDGGFDSGVLAPGAEYTLTFDEPGEYEYYCELHHGMYGTIVVEEP